MPKISPKRIVCPVTAYQYFTKGKSHCRNIKCCYHCQRQGKCQDNGCARNNLDGYPKTCPVYPLTFGEAQRIFLSFRLFNKKALKSPSMEFIYYGKQVKKYIEEKKKHAKKGK